MDSFVAALKSGLGTDQLTTSEDGEAGQRPTKPLDPRDKLPTRLSGKPTEFEKELRDLVLKVYSDQSLMSHPVESPVSPRPDDLISGRMRELLSDFRAEPVPEGEVGSSGESGAPHDSPGLFQSFHYDDTDSFPPRSLSVSETELLTPAFNDSGIQLEFVMSESDNSDTCSVDSGGPCGEPCAVGVSERDFSYLTGTTGNEIQSFQEDSATSDLHDLRFLSDLLTTAPLSGTLDRVVQNVTVTQGTTDHDNTHSELRARGAIFPSDQRISTSGITRRVTEKTVVTQESCHETSDDVLFSSDKLTAVTLPGTVRRVVEGTTVTQDSSHGKDEESRGEADGHAITLERANIEGRVELLHAEYSSVLQERKMLKLQLRGVEAKLKKELEKAKNPSDQSDMTGREKLEQKCLAIEKELVKVQSDCQTKEDDLTDAREQLYTTQITTRSLREKLTRLERELGAREESINTLRNEMENIQRSLTTTVEKNKSLNQEKDVLSSDVAALISAKEWFQKQLVFAQEARAKLQLEISEYESTVAGQNRIIEQLKCDGASTSQQLTTLQQNALDDKSKVLKHLEIVEEDMITQGLALKQIQLEKQTMERGLKVKIDALQKENEDLNKLTSAVRDLELELTNARQKARTNGCLLDNIRQEKEQVEAQLSTTLNTVEKLQAKLDELKVLQKTADRALKAERENGEANSVLIQSLKEEKRKLEENLETVKEEKEAFDSAVGILKVDLDRVERRFKLMKRELTKKTVHLEQITRQKDGFIHELPVLRDELERQLGMSEALRADMAQKDKLIDELQGVRVQLEQEVAGLTEELKQSEVQRAQVDLEAKRLDEKLKSADRERTEVEGKLLVSLAENARMEGELETSQEAWGEEVNSLNTQIKRLRDEMAKVKRSSQIDFLKERDKIVGLEQKLELARQELLQKEDKLMLDLQAVQEKLEQEKEGKEAAETQLKKLHKATEHSLEQLKKKYLADLQQAQAQSTALLEAKNQLEKELERLKTQSSHQMESMKEETRSLKAELTSARNNLKQRREEVSRMQLVAIELEREKGRCSGILASQRILREHAAKLEEVLGTREAALAEMTSNFECSEKERKLQQRKTGEKIDLLESSLKSQRDVTQELRSLVNKEKKEKAKLKEVYQESKQELEETQERLLVATSEGHRLVEELERVRGEVKRNSGQLQRVQGELESSQLARGKLHTRLNVLRDEEKAREDRVAAVQWEATQRQREVEYLKEQLRLMEERQQMELENLRSGLQVSRSEVTSLRAEVSDVRKARCEKQSEVFDLRDALLSAKQDTECVRQQLFTKCQELDAIKNAVHVASDVNLLRELVSRDEAGNIRDCEGESCESVVTEEADTISPLKSLRSCMDSLRCQIVNLEQQMNHHTDAVHTSASSWRTFEKNVKELQVSCSTSKTQVLPAERDTN